MRDSLDPYRLAGLIWKDNSTTFRSTSSVYGPAIADSALGKPDPAALKSQILPEATESVSQTTAQATVSQTLPGDRDGFVSDFGPKSVNRLRLKIPSPFQTVDPRRTRSGYRESIPRETPPPQLKVTLRTAEAQQKVQEKPVDLFSLSSSLFTGTDVNREFGIQIDEEAVKTLNKFVGCLTMKGKKATAQRIVLDAMLIIKKTLDSKPRETA